MVLRLLQVCKKRRPQRLLRPCKKAGIEVGRLEVLLLQQISLFFELQPHRAAFVPVTLWAAQAVGLLLSDSAARLDFQRRSVFRRHAITP